MEKKSKPRSALFLTAMLCLAAVIFCAEAARAKAAAKPLAPEKSSFDNRKYDIGFSGGAWLPGTINIEDVDADKEMGLLLRGIADAYLMPNFAVGVYFNYSNTPISYESLKADGWFYEYGISLKPRFMINPELAVKPGLNIGYRSLDRESLYPGEENTSAEGMGLNLSIEIQIPVTTDYLFFADVGFLSQPTGGNDVADVTWSPIFYLNAGLAF